MFNVNLDEKPFALLWNLVNSDEVKVSASHAEVMGELKQALRHAYEVRQAVESEEAKEPG